jgi:hypothetical protein
MAGKACAVSRPRTLAARGGGTPRRRKYPVRSVKKAVAAETRSAAASARQAGRSGAVAPGVSTS